MTDFKGFSPRLNMKGYTQMPNEFFDEVLPNITSLAELKVLLAVFRKTYGWISHIDNETGQVVYKEADAIAMSQFKELTGLSVPSCVEGVRRGIDHGYLERVKEGHFGGGDASLNESAVYAIRQKGPNPVPEGTPPIPPKKEKAAAKPQTERKEPIGDMSLNNAADEKASPEDTLAELFGTPANTEPEPEKPKVKDPSKWTCNDVLAFFNREYRTVMGHSAGPITSKLRANAKKMLEGYSGMELKTAILFYLLNYKSLQFHPASFPSFDIFFGYRQSIMPMALGTGEGKKASAPGGKKANLDMREYQGDTSGEDKGGYEW